MCNLNIFRWLRESVKKKIFHSMSASLAHRYTSSSSKPTTAILPKKTTDVAERYDDLSPHPVLADSFAPGFHYHSCEHCHTGNEAIPCSLCPCRYHAKCVLGDESVRDLEDKSKWICPKCM